MFTLDYLRVAAGALKPLASFKVFEMDGVVKNDVFELHLAFQEAFFMAAFLQAAFISNLSPGF